MILLLRICLRIPISQEVFAFHIVLLVYLSQLTVHSRFNKFHWIHYDAVSDSAFCFVCCKAIKQKTICVSGLIEHFFIANGFTNWRDAIRIFAKHEASHFHK